jgi:hypothetical protein
MFKEKANIDIEEPIVEEETTQHQTTYEVPEEYEYGNFSVLFQHFISTSNN